MVSLKTYFWMSRTTIEISKEQYNKKLQINVFHNNFNYSLSAH